MISLLFSLYHGGTRDSKHTADFCSWHWLHFLDFPPQELHLKHFILFLISHFQLIFHYLSIHFGSLLFLPIPMLLFFSNFGDRAGWVGPAPPPIGAGWGGVGLSGYLCGPGVVW